MASIRKVLRSAIPSSRNNVMEGKENKGYTETPHSKRRSNSKDNRKSASLSEKLPSMPSSRSEVFRRNSSVTLSVRDVVGNFRQKLKKSTRQRKRLQDGHESPVISAFRMRKNKSSKRTPTRKGGYREVKMYSPFTIETPKTPQGIRTRPIWHDVETPTKLRKEVEELTANMKALVNLTPRTLQTRAASRRSLLSASPLTNGSLKTPKSNRKAALTARRHVQTTEV